MKQNSCLEPTPLEGISYFQPAEGYRISGRDGRVDIPFEFPIPLSDEDYRAALEEGQPGYDQVGQGMFRALRQNPACVYAMDYARVLQDGYPHIIAEIGGVRRLGRLPIVDPLNSETLAAAFTENFDPADFA